VEVEEIVRRLLQQGDPVGHWVIARAVAGTAADGAVVWICGSGGLLAQPNDNPTANPGSLGTCPPSQTNPSPTVSNAAWDASTGTLYANASSATTAFTPRAWAPLDGRITLPVPEAHALHAGAAALLALGGLARRGRRSFAGLATPARSDR